MLFRNFIELLFDKKIFTLRIPTSNTTQIRYRGKNYHQSKLLEVVGDEGFIYSNFTEAGLTHKEIMKIAEDRQRLTLPRIQDIFEGVVKSYIKKGVRESLSTHLDYLEPLVDMISGDVIMWDQRSSSISKMSYVAYKEILGPRRIAKRRELDPYRFARFDYNPYDLYTRRDSPGQDTMINLYRPPVWRKLKEGPRLDPIIADFLKHLFPEKKDRRIIISWIKEAILNRVSHIMVLLGPRGVGKNLFVEHLVKALVGPEYFAKAPKGFFESRFQDVLVNNRLIFFDELEAKETKHMSDIKRLANHTQGIEKKGRDIQQMQIYYSCIANTNDPKAFPIEYDERRLYFPEITEDKLNEVWDSEKIQSFMGYFDDPKQVSALGNFILSTPTDPDFNSENAYINDKFLRLVDINLRPSHRFILHYAKNMSPGDFISYTDLKEEYFLEGASGRFLSDINMELFVKDFRYQGKPIGEWVEVDGERGLKV